MAEKTENKRTQSVRKEQKDTKDQTKKSTTKNKRPKTSPLAGQVKKLNAELEALNDKYIRLSAEYDNYRKRTLKEKMELVKSGGEDVLLDILPVVDNLERALQAIRDAREIEAVKEGVELINNRFREFLKQKGITEINCMNEEFDLDQHEAITKIPAPKPELKGKVVDVIEKGYLLHDRVIRYAKVVIGE